MRFVEGPVQDPKEPDVRPETGDARRGNPCSPALRVGYVLLRFPHLTETFVAEEIRAITDSGTEVEIISMLSPLTARIQPLSRQLLERTWYPPGFLSPRLWTAQLHYLRTSPKKYVRLLTTLMRQSCPSPSFVPLAKRMTIFLKAVASARRLEGRGFDHLHAHFAWLSGAAAWIIAGLTELPYTITVHAYDLFVSNDLLSLVCRAARRVIAISEYNKKEIVRLEACPEERISVIHCGIDLNRFRATYDASRSIDPFPSLRILSVGSLLVKKGHRVLISACRLLQERGIGFLCTIIGGGPEAQALARQVEESHLQGQVLLLGPRTQPEIIEEYEKQDVFVLASVTAPNGDSDGIPVVLMEAGAAGLPLVSTHISGIPEIVRQGYSGLLVPPQDPKALADALESLAADPKLRIDLGRNAHSVVETSFDIRQNARALRDLWMDVRTQGCTKAQ